MVELACQQVIPLTQNAQVNPPFAQATGSTVTPLPILLMPHYHVTHLYKSQFSQNELTFLGQNYSHASSASHILLPSAGVGRYHLCYIVLKIKDTPNQS